MNHCKYALQHIDYHAICVLVIHRVLSFCLLFENAMKEEQLQKRWRFLCFDIWEGGTVTEGNTRV